MPPSGETTDFGFRQVPLAHKQARVDEVFHSVASRYDLMNDLMSGGLHRAWKDALVTAVNPPRDRPSAGAHAGAGARPFALLDLAGGTGDIAFRVVEFRRRWHAHDRGRHQCRHACRRASACGHARAR